LLLSLLSWINQAKAAAKMQLSHWGIGYFDLFLIHFPIALQYVDPQERYPPEWFGDDGKVHLRELKLNDSSLGVRR
jgi:D-xylose reductase